MPRKAPVPAWGAIRSSKAIAHIHVVEDGPNCQALALGQRSDRKRCISLHSCRCIRGARETDSQVRAFDHMQRQECREMRSPSLQATVSSETMETYLNLQFLLISALRS